MNIIIMTILTISAILYRISKIICIINVILYIIFMEKFSNNRKIPLCILATVIMYFVLLLLSSKMHFDNIFIISTFYYVIFIINIILTVKTIGVIKRKE